MTEPLSINEVASSKKLLGPFYSGDSWGTWRTILRAAEGQELTEAEQETFRAVAGGRNPPKQRVSELWVAGGRRGGKDSIAALIAVTASIRDYSEYLRPGERATVICMAVDRAQAAIVKRYVSGLFSKVPLLQSLVVKDTRDGLLIGDTTEIEIITADHRSLRGRAVVCCILDECAFYPTDGSSSSDIQIYEAVKPAMATLPNSMLVAISTPYSRRGLLFTKYRQHFGQDTDDALFIQADSKTLNPLLSQSIIDAAYADDPASAAAEYGGLFRSDIDSFVDRKVVEACIEPGVFERPPARSAGRRYSAFIDAAGGSGSDSMVLAISHCEDNIPTLDALRERKPPFSPDDVVSEFASLMKLYGVSKAESDRWGGDWVTESFRKHLITVAPTARPKSQIYTETLPMLNATRCALLDNQRLINQLIALERRTSRGGRDSIDHGINGHDDVANAAMGALLLVSERFQMKISQQTLEMSRRPVARHAY